MELQSSEVDEMRPISRQLNNTINNLGTHKSES